MSIHKISKRPFVVFFSSVHGFRNMTDDGKFDASLASEVDVDMNFTIVPFLWYFHYHVLFENARAKDKNSKLIINDNEAYLRVFD